MKIIIAGGNGFLGDSLTEFFEAKRDKVKVLTRSPKNERDIKWNAKDLGTWVEELENADVLINLVGKSVDCRYTDANKKEILDSRINSTRALQKALEQCQNPPKIWLNASSATIYIHAETESMTEAIGRVGDDFSMNICKSWEKEFYSFELPQTRKVALRTSIVLGNKGGAFPKLKLVTKLGLGGIQGSGLQKVSWIHIDDFCKAIEFIITKEHLKGNINITAPNPISNEILMMELRKTMKVPFGIPSPVFLLEFASLFLRTETELLLKSRNVYPEILIKEGFEFDFADFKKALVELIG